MLGASAICATAAHGGRFSSTFDGLTHFALLYLVLGLLAWFGLLVLERGRRCRVASLIVSVTIAGSLALIIPGLRHALPPAAQGDEAMRLKIIQFNLNNDPGWDARVVEWLVGENPDVIVLEDLLPGLKGRLEDKFKGYSLVCTPGCALTILSRRKPIHAETFQGELYGLTPTTGLVRFEGPGGPFAIVGTHLGRPLIRGPDSPRTFVEVQAANMARLEKILAPLPRRTTILVGDFNSTPWSFARRRSEDRTQLFRHTRCNPTWPATPLGGAFLPIDQVYAGGDWRALDVRRGPYLGSDHLPIVAVMAREAPIVFSP